MHFREIPGLLSGGWMASVGVGGRPGSREASRVVMGDRQEPGSSADKLALLRRPGRDELWHGDMSPELAWESGAEA